MKEFQIQDPKFDSHLRENLDSLENTLATKRLLSSGHACKEICNLILKYLDSKLEILKPQMLIHIKQEKGNNKALRRSLETFLMQLNTLLQSEIEKFNSDTAHVKRILIELSFIEKAKPSVENAMSQICYEFDSHLELTQKERIENHRHYYQVLREVIFFIIGTIVGSPLFNFILNKN
jgi:hypothetical protein